MTAALLWKLPSAATTQPNGSHSNVAAMSTVGRPTQHTAIIDASAAALLITHLHGHEVAAVTCRRAHASAAAMYNSAHQLPQLPPLLSGGELLHRNLLLLSLPPDPSYSLSPTLFSVPHPRAFIHILHHLLSPLPTLPLPYPRFLLSLLSSFPASLSLCYPPTSPTEAREFLTLCFPLLVGLEEWKERAILPPGCVRKSVMQAGGGEKVVGLLVYLSTWRVREKLEEEEGGGGGVGPVGSAAWKGWDEGVGLDETVRGLQAQVVATGQQTVAALQEMEAEQRQWTETAAALQVEWRRVQEQLKEAQQEEKRLRASIDPAILSDGGAQQRSQMADALTAEYSHRAAFLQRSQQQRQALVELVNGAWTPTTISGAELQSAWKKADVASVDERCGEKLELAALMRAWKAELLQVKGELEAASSESRRDAAVQAETEVQQCTAHQQRLHGELGRLQSELTAAMSVLPEVRPRAASARAAAARQGDSPSFFTLYRARPWRTGQQEGCRETRPVTPLPSLAELSLHDVSEQQVQEAATGAAEPLITPVKSSTERHDASLPSSPPAYMAGGGLLDDEQVDAEV